MTEAQYNPDDMAFLASRGLDEELSEAERKRLASALAASESLRTEAEELRTVDGLVKRWAAGQAELDWEHHHALISARVEGGEDSDASRRLDDLLARWGASSVPLDERQFTKSVMAGIEPRRTIKLARRMVFRVGMPLAAAAALALALTGRSWFTPTPAAVSVIVFPGERTADAGSTGGPRLGGEPVAVVSFNREPVAETAIAKASGGISFGSAGATPMPMTAEEAPPI